ncbi:MAG: methyltransferase domain-containing protein [Candidatus Lokiarchaeota archaeon]
MSFDYNFHVKKERPEDIFNDVRDYYTNSTLLDYASSKNMQRIQERLTKRVLELLDFKHHDKLILDAGCGPGFASFYMQREGYTLISLDLIKEFLNFYDMTDLKPINGDMCHLPIKPNTFDGIISISALQWIFRDINKKSERMRLIELVKSFYHALKQNVRLLFSFTQKVNQF